MSETYSPGQTLAPPPPLAEVLRKMREKRGEKLRVVAASADMDASILSKIELGRRPPTRNQCAALARHFGVPPVQLEAVRMAEEIQRMMAENPEAAALASSRIEESACEYRVNKQPAAASNRGKAVNKRRKKG